MSTRVSCTNVLAQLYKAEQYPVQLYPGMRTGTRVHGYLGIHTGYGYRTRTGYLGTRGTIVQFVVPCMHTNLDFL